MTGENRVVIDPAKSPSCKVQAVVRVRPLIAREILTGSAVICSRNENDPRQVVRVPVASCRFTFDNVYWPEHSESDIYQESVRPMLNSLFDGFNMSILAYGQTCSGKTHTLGVASDSIETGIVSKIMDDIFNRIDVDRAKFEHFVSVSVLEVYCESVRDLLGADVRKDISDTMRGEKSEMRIGGLTEWPVMSGQECFRLFQQAIRNRTVAETEMNTDSSRSHAIYTVYLSRRRRSDDGADDCSQPSECFCAKLQVVDLAGSERQTKTKTEGVRFKESVKINLGLLAIRNVISMLATVVGNEDTHGNRHIPYRNSRLTRILQDSLGGNSNTVIIACVSPASDNLEETISTLRYAANARNIKNIPISNKEKTDHNVIKRLNDEIAELKRQIADLNQNKSFCQHGPTVPSNPRVSCSRIVSLTTKLQPLLTSSLMTSDHFLDDDKRMRFQQLVRKICSQVKKTAETPDRDPTQNSEADAQDDPDKTLMAGKTIQAVNDVSVDGLDDCKDSDATVCYTDGISEKHHRVIKDLENAQNERNRGIPCDSVEDPCSSGTGDDSNELEQKRKRKITELGSKVRRLKEQNQKCCLMVAEKVRLQNECSNLEDKTKSLKQELVQLTRTLRHETETRQRQKAQLNRERLKLKSQNAHHKYRIGKVKSEIASRKLAVDRKTTELKRLAVKLNELAKRQQAEKEKKIADFRRHDRSSCAQVLRDRLNDECSIFIKYESLYRQIEQMWCDRQRLNDEIVDEHQSSDAVMAKLDELNRQIDMAQSEVGQLGDMSKRMDHNINRLIKGVPDGKVLVKHIFTKLVNVQKQYEAMRQDNESVLVNAVQVASLSNRLEHMRSRRSRWQKPYENVVKKYAGLLVAYAKQNSTDFKNMLSSMVASQQNPEYHAILEALMKQTSVSIQQIPEYMTVVENENRPPKRVRFDVCDSEHSYSTLTSPVSSIPTEPGINCNNTIILDSSPVSNITPPDNEQVNTPPVAWDLRKRPCTESPRLSKYLHLAINRKSPQQND